MARIFQTFISLVLILSISSCFPSYLASEKPINIPQSKFAAGDAIGMNKNDIIKKFGLPISTSIEKKENIVLEDLYYTELLGDINLVTIIQLENKIAIRQKVEQINSNYDERFKRIERDLKILQTPRIYN